ncbi:hypothetical protein FZW96_00475 [Bacillus sp. BGMRC 2118]|nr:hypothetical protein FZW96_00475 [Bacillus sp. BGMRC 2118]
MSSTAQMIIFFVSIITVIVLFRKSKEQEPYLLIKLFGYMFLGAFLLDLNGLKLPLGFAIFLLFFRKKKMNADTKYIAAYVGLAIFMLGIFVPQIERFVFERTHHIELLDTNFFSGSLVKELEHLRDELKVEGDPTELRGFDMTIQEDGTYENLSIGLAEQTHEGTVNYTIELSSDGKALDVSRYKVQEEEVFEDYRFTEAAFTFARLDLLSSNMLEFGDANYFNLTTDGRRVAYEQTATNTYQINTAGKMKVVDNQLPVQAIVVHACGGKELNEFGNPLKCEQNEELLFDMLKK